MLKTEELEKFIDEYGDHAYNFAFSLCSNEPEARELVQDGFIRIFERAEQYDNSQPLHSWYLTILKNIFYDSRRRWERKYGISLDAPINEEGKTVIETMADPHEQIVLDNLEKDEKIEHVQKVMAELSAASRAVLTLVDLEDLSYEETANILNWPLGTVRSRLNRARADLKKRLLKAEETFHHG